MSFKIIAKSVCMHCGQACERRETSDNDFGEPVAQWVHYTGDVICAPVTTVKPDPVELEILTERWLKSGGA